MFPTMSIMVSWALAGDFLCTHKVSCPTVGLSTLRVNLGSDVSEAVPLHWRMPTPCLGTKVVRRRESAWTKQKSAARTEKRENTKLERYGRDWVERN